MTRYISLAEYLWLAEQVTGVEALVLTKAARTELADSALHSPEAASAVTSSTASWWTRRRYSSAG